MSATPQIEQLLRREIGLDPASIGSSAIRGALQLCMERRGIRNTEEFSTLLQSSPDALQELIEQVVIPETWFFRDGEPFAALTRWVSREWLTTSHDSVLRILSIPCATGEEPYSIAMALLDAGIPARNFHITAVDVSQKAIRRAQNGIYGRNAFRTPDLRFRDRHFHEVPQGHKISEAVKSRVEFRQGNLLDLAGSGIVGIFDVIFCRNVLIYLDAASQAQVSQTVWRLLSPDGLLFVGHAEVSVVATQQFASTDAPAAFLCRKKSDVPAKPLLRVHKTSLRSQSTPFPVRKQVSLPPPPRFTTQPCPSPGNPPATTPGTKPALEMAAELANRGALREAAEVCTNFLRDHPDSARGHYLLGLTLGALGEDMRAAEQYRKALYLDPTHLEAMAQLTLFLEQQGDAAGAQRLRTRARRLPAPDKQVKA